MKVLIILTVGILLASLFFAISQLDDIALRYTVVGILSMLLSYLLCCHLDFNGDDDLGEYDDLY